MNNFKNVRGINCQLYLNHSSKQVWNVISAPNHLNLFHPFCKKNSVISWEETSHIDELEYLQNGFHLKDMNLKLGKGTKINLM